MNAKSFTAAILISVITVACSPEAAIDAKPNAEALATAYFDGLKSGKSEQTLQSYDDRFWGAVSKEQWLQIQRNIPAELGQLQSCSLQNWNQTTKVSTELSGTFVTLVYGCVHKKYNATVSFVVRVPLQGGDPKIMSQNYSSIGFLLE